MATQTLGRTLGYGALAGAVAGGVGAAAQYWLVEPSIRAAIVIEEAHTKVAGAAGHAHMSQAIVTRAQQVVFGALTTLLVGTLIGIAFALAHRHLGPRLTGRDLPGSALVLAALGFVSFTLAPAIVIPANPPSVGDPATVNARTLTYVGTIFLAAVFTSAVVAVSRARTLTSRQRLVAATVASFAGLAILLWVVPNRSDAISPDVPAALIWNFRIGSLTEIGLMWLFLAATFGWLSMARDRQPAVVRHAVSTRV